jgi:N-acetylmuramoyl-L-alanine amidase
MMFRTWALLILTVTLLLVPAAPRTGVLAQSSPNPPSAEFNVRRADGGRSATVELRQLAAPDEEWFIGSRELSDILGVGRFWRTDVRKLVLRVDDQRITFTVGARSVVGAQQTLLLRQPVQYFEGETWIPLEFLSAVLPRITDRVAGVDVAEKSISLGERRLNVEGLDVQTDGDQTILQLRLQSALAFRVDDSRVQNLVIKLYGGALDPGRIRLNSPRGLIDKVRSRQEEGYALVEVDLSQLASRYQSLTEDGGKTILLRIDPAPVTLIPEPRPRGAHVVQTLPPEQRGRKVEVRRIVVDAGHGGGDLGAEGLGGIREKDITLAVAKELKSVLERRHDIEVILTRDGDESVGLVERTETANRYSADIFISLHCNAWPNAQAHGVETYFLSPAKTEWDADVARKENASVGAAEDLDFILWDLVQNAYIQESATLAEEVQARMSSDLGMSDRGVKQAGFRVLVGAFMPAILVEMGFVTNRRDSAKLSDPDFHRQVAEAMAEAIVEFRTRMDALRESSR